MKLYVTRHGETGYNVDHRVSGRTDIPLTQRGREQARLLALEAKKYPIDVIIASPMQRAMDTARAVATELGLPIIQDTRLVEQDYGIYEGRDRHDPDFVANRQHFACRNPGGESVLDLAHRVYSVLEELPGKYPGKNVLLVCHGAVCRVIHTYFTDLRNEEFLNYFLPNAQLIMYEL